MRPSKRLFVVISMLLLASLACQTLTDGMGSGDSSPTTAAEPTFPPQPTSDPAEPTNLPPPNQAQPTTPPQPASGEVLFTDDFSDPDSGWDRYSDSDGSTDYGNGVYVINVTTEQQIFWANPGEYFGDVRVDVDATFTNGEVDNSFGIICRHKDVENFYALVISSDGYWAIRKRFQGSELAIISADNYTYSDDIPQGKVTNHITAECIGSTIRLSVNGTVLGEVIDFDITAGDVGLIGTTFSATLSEVQFDNLVVSQP